VIWHDELVDSGPEKCRHGAYRSNGCEICCTLPRAVPEPPPRCPSCCRHGVPLTAIFCAWCEDADDGYDDGPFMDEPQWLCPHGIGEDPRAVTP
jgi:hypothetical protein